MDQASLVHLRGEASGARPRIAVDAMGGDHAPEEVVRGSLDWARLHPDVDVLLVGDEPLMRPFIDGSLPAHVSIVQAAESVGMDEQAATAVRRKRDASINVCMRLVRDGRADAVVTAGHTGACVASAILHLGRLHGVDRPALAIQMVTDRGPFVLLDIGATTDSTGLNLAQYAHMGALYAERVLGVRDPSVALLSIGEEGGKGEQRVQQASALLSSSRLRFVGNVEGRDLPRHPADVVVCDASVGNVVMKFFEGLATMMFDLLRREFKRPPWGPVGYFFMRPGIRRIRDGFDYERLGAAPLLGVKGMVLITHGRATRRMIGFAVEVGAASARAGIPDRIAASLAGSGTVSEGRLGRPRAAESGPSREQSGHDAAPAPPDAASLAQNAADASSGTPAATGHGPAKLALNMPRGAAGGADAGGHHHRAEREGRRLCLEAVFEADFGQRTAARALERRLAEVAAGPATAAHARLLVEAVTLHRDAIDDRIERAAPSYPVVSLARIDRALLRSGMGELLHCAPTPTRVAISEWVELARAYSGEPARRLVNGVLGRVAREAAAAGGAPRDTDAVGHDSGSSA